MPYFTKVRCLQDGLIDFKEFMIVLYIMSNGTPEENLRQIFRVFDINNDGKISVAELKRIVRDLHHLLNDKNNSFDEEVVVTSGVFPVDKSVLI